MANGDGLTVGSPDLEPATVEEMTRRLLRVLDDENATMVPPSAHGMSEEEWAELSPAERAHYGRLQLRSLDPRLLSRAVLRWSGRRFIHARR